MQERTGSRPTDANTDRTWRGRAAPLQILTRIVAACLVATSIMVILIARTYDYLSSTGPGPGFFPLWLGIAMLVLSLIWSVQLMAERTREGCADPVVPKAVILPIAATMGGALAYAFLLPALGYPITMTLYMMLLFSVISAMKPAVVALMATVISLTSYYAMNFGMGIQLPRSPFALLGQLGL